ncbi:hypothetical protein KKC1_32690 [Calderihabitans maritimus]|uniref:Uncharacterized protein n=1 Tax=Calderihabitans maritimus TaxID=1246530 RepID=A0A1Z5HXA0_9FIRM|nr:hypothetical protein KKC1_32690 [Calderihabitans maritimus]
MEGKGGRKISTTSFLHKVGNWTIFILKRRRGQI